MFLSHIGKLPDITPLSETTYSFPLRDWSDVVGYLTDTLKLAPGIRGPYKGSRFKVSLWNRRTYEGKVIFFSNERINLRKGKYEGERSFSVENIREFEKVMPFWKNLKIYEDNPPRLFRFNSEQVP